jgi:CRISPR-associated endoribonuclease Cas6
MATRSPRSRPSVTPTWAPDTELVGIVLNLQPDRDGQLYPQYAIGLHAWFLDQVRQHDPDLSASLHDEQAEKPFTLSRLIGVDPAQGGYLPLYAAQTYRWKITGLSHRVVEWLAVWLRSLPPYLDLRDIKLRITGWTIAQPPTTYAQVLKTAPASPLTLSFVSPTSFRHRGHHLPLPLPTNVFHSYLRRWNTFAATTYDGEDFLDWVDEVVVISQHQLQSIKVLGGKRGSVTGFIGSVEFGLNGKYQDELDYRQLFFALGQLAPYTGTGHKTTFGLGQTQLGWQEPTAPRLTSLQDLLAERIAYLTEQFVALKQRQGGERAIRSAETWATILARRELGESLQTIAADLEMPYETVKSYVKLARRAIES